MKNQYAAAIKSILPTSSYDSMTERQFILLEAAEACDTLIAQLESDLRYVARSMTRAADALASGYVDDPTSSSTLRDITVRSADLRAAQKHVLTLIKMTETRFEKSTDARKAYIAALESV